MLPNVRSASSREGHAPGLRRHATGFSLVEIAIVLSVIAVLGAVVIAGRGYLVSARHKTAVDLVLTTHKAARQFSMRHQGGVRYGRPTDTRDKELTISNLRAQGFLPEKVKTPWQAKDDTRDRVTVTAVNAPAKCLDFTCVSIVLHGVPSNECPDLEIAFKNKAIESRCQGDTLTVVMR